MGKLGSPQPRLPPSRFVVRKLGPEQRGVLCGHAAGGATAGDRRQTPGPPLFAAHPEPRPHLTEPRLKRALLKRGSAPLQRPPPRLTCRGARGGRGGQLEGGRWLPVQVEVAVTQVPAPGPAVQHRLQHVGKQGVFPPFLSGEPGVSGGSLPTPRPSPAPRTSGSAAVAAVGSSPRCRPLWRPGTWNPLGVSQAWRRLFLASFSSSSGS